MLRSRRWSLGCAAVAGLVAMVPSVFLGGLALMAAAHAASPNFGLIAAFFLVPMIIPVGVVALLSTGRNRLLSIGVGLAGWIAGFALMFAWSGINDLLLPEVKVQFVNTTGDNLLTYYAREGQSLFREYPLRPGETPETAIGIRKRGPWLRIVAYRMDGSMDFRDVQELGKHLDTFPTEVTANEELKLADRKVFDETFTWDALARAGNRIVITPSRGSSE